MTPAIKAAKRSKTAFTVHEYEHEASEKSYGKEAAEKMGVAPDRVFKTLVATGDGKDFYVAVVPVTRQLDLKLLAKAVGVKKAAMADGKDVERVTGYVLGGVSPLGQKKRCRTVIDASAEDLATMFVSAGRRGLEIELAPGDLATLTNAAFVTVAK